MREQINYDSLFFIYYPLSSLWSHFGLIKAQCYFLPFVKMTREKLYIILSNDEDYIIV
jgi:hypothetical protein